MSVVSVNFVGALCVEYFPCMAWTSCCTSKLFEAAMAKQLVLTRNVSAIKLAREQILAALAARSHLIRV